MDYNMKDYKVNNNNNNKTCNCHVALLPGFLAIAEFDTKLDNCNQTFEMVVRLVKEANYTTVTANSVMTARCNLVKKGNKNQMLDAMKVTIIIKFDYSWQT